MILVPVILAVKDNAVGNCKTHEHNNKVHLGRGTFVHRQIILLFLLLLFDAIKGGDSSLHSTLLAKLVRILLLDLLLLVSQAHLFACFGAVVQLGAYHLEQLVRISVISFELLTIHSYAWVQVDVHVRFLLEVAVKKRLCVRVPWYC
jgi:hypothetical protein